MNSRRIAKAQESFKREISNIIFSMKDARLHKKLVTVTSVELSNDCLFCKAYISSVDGFKHSKIICKILNHAANYIQMTLAINLKTRFMPKVLFIPSDSEEYAFKINNILSKSNKSTLFEISEFLRKNNNFAIVTHVIPDGDAISSCGALYLALKQIGKNAKVIFDKEIPEKLKFLLNYFDNKDKFEPKNFICLDVSDKKRIFAFEDLDLNKKNSSKKGSILTINENILFKNKIKRKFDLNANKTGVKKSRICLKLPMLSGINKI